MVLFVQVLVLLSPFGLPPVEASGGAPGAWQEAGASQSGVSQSNAACANGQRGGEGSGPMRPRRGDATAVVMPDDPFDRSTRELRSRFASTRARAVRRLAGLDEPRAWDLVLRALADPEGAVGEAAQVALRGATDRRVRAEVLGRAGLTSRKAFARRRAAACIGHWVPAPPAADLGRALRRLEGPALVALLGSAERLGLAGAWRSLPSAARGGEGEDPAGGVAASAGGARPPTSERRALARAVERLVTSRREGVRAEALLALAALDRGAARQRAGALVEDRDPRVRVASLLVESETPVVGGLTPGPGASALTTRGVERGITLLEDPDVRVRRGAILALAATPRRRAISGLVARLETEPRRRLRADLVHGLRRASGLRFGADPRPWRDWLQRLPVGDPLPSPFEARGSAADVGGSTARAAPGAALPLASDHLALLIDLSGSVSRVLADGRTRRDLVDAAVLATLAASAPGTTLQLVPFTATPQPIPERPEALSPRLARRWSQEFTDLRPRGPGDLWEAIEETLIHRELDTLVVLTDGVPTGGFHAEPRVFVEQLLPGLRLDPVAVDLVLVDAGPSLRRRWEPLTQRTGGELSLRSFPEPSAARDGQRR